jgi:hypothetical protein
VKVIDTIVLAVLVAMLGYNAVNGLWVSAGINAATILGYGAIVWYADRRMKRRLADQAEADRYLTEIRNHRLKLGVEPMPPTGDEDGHA